VRLQDNFKKDVEIVMATHTQGGWASKGVVDGKEEVEHLRKYYTVQHKLTFPIAMFEGEKHATEDGGMVPADDPNAKAYSVFSIPQIVVVDTKGIIRQILPSLSRADEERINTKLRQLLEEQGGAAKSSGTK
jgi:hypothetical protein